MQYIGKGAHIRGIPARDLSRVEVLRFGGEEFLRSTGLYRSWPGERVAKPVEAATHPDEITADRLPVEESAPVTGAPELREEPSVEPKRRRKLIRIEESNHKENEL